jgi:hypothetical protein
MANYTDIVNLLTERGIEAYVEHDWISTPVNDGGCIAWGTINSTWDGDVWTADYGEMVETIESDLTEESSASDIATHICCAVVEAKER